MSEREAILCRLPVLGPRRLTRHPMPRAEPCPQHAALVGTLQQPWQVHGDVRPYASICCGWCLRRHASGAPRPTMCISAWVRVPQPRDQQRRPARRNGRRRVPTCRHLTALSASRWYRGKNGHRGASGLESRRSGRLRVMACSCTSLSTNLVTNTFPLVSIHIRADAHLHACVQSKENSPRVSPKRSTPSVSHKLVCLAIGSHADFRPLGLASVLKHHADFVPGEPYYEAS